MEYIRKITKECQDNIIKESKLKYISLDKNDSGDFKISKIDNDKWLFQQCILYSNTDNIIKNCQEELKEYIDFYSGEYHILYDELNYLKEENYEEFKRISKMLNQIFDNINSDHKIVKKEIEEFNKILKNQFDKDIVSLSFDEDDQNNTFPYLYIDLNLKLDNIEKSNMIKDKAQSINKN